MIGGRYLSIASVLSVAALGAGFGAWSGLTGPQVAGAQLEAASVNTAGTSFVAVVDVTQSVVGTIEVIRSHDVNVWQPPGRASQIETVAVTGADHDVSYSRTITRVGDSCWTTVEGPASLKPLLCTKVNVRPMTSAETASGVTDVDGTYALDAAASQKFVSAGTSGTVGMCAVEARLSGSFITWQQISFTVALTSATVEVLETARFSHVGHAPPIATPSGPPTATAS
jgi:hypothetical protein